GGGQAWGAMGILTARVISTLSSAPPPLTLNRAVAGPARGAERAKRTSAEPFWSMSIDWEAGPLRVNPVTLISTSTLERERPLLVTTTPASRLSPARTKRGKAGRAMSGRLVVTRDSA